MTTNFENAFAEVKKLAEDFENNFSHYMSAGYSEADARKDFID